MTNTISKKTTILVAGLAAAGLLLGSTAVSAHPAAHHQVPQGKPQLPNHQAPPLKWERIIKKCGAPCLIWARHILDLATSPKGFVMQLKLLGHAVKKSVIMRQIRPRQARFLARRIRRMGMTLRRMTADKLLDHRERLMLLREIIKTGAILHKVKRANAIGLSAHPRTGRPGRERRGALPRAPWIVIPPQHPKAGPPAPVPPAVPRRDAR